MSGRIRVRRGGDLVSWSVDNSWQWFFYETWREAMDVAMRWAYAGEHP